MKNLKILYNFLNKFIVIFKLYLLLTKYISYINCNFFLSNHSSIQIKLIFFVFILVTH